MDYLICIDKRKYKMVMKMAMKKKENKVMVSYRISAETKARVQRAQEACKAAGMAFNLSAEVDTFLQKRLKEVEKELKIQQDIKEAEAQTNLF